ncbi:hypothetical protein ACE6H2_009028 [Prunus campanulata]
MNFVINLMGLGSWFQADEWGHLHPVSLSWLRPCGCAHEQLCKGNGRRVALQKSPQKTAQCGILAGFDDLELKNHRLWL